MRLFCLIDKHRSAWINIMDLNLPLHKHLREASQTIAAWNYG